MYLRSPKSGSLQRSLLFIFFLSLLPFLFLLSFFFLAFKTFLLFIRVDQSNHSIRSILLPFLVSLLPLNLKPVIILASWPETWSGIKNKFNKFLKFGHGWNIRRSESTRRIFREWKTSSNPYKTQDCRIIRLWSSTLWHLTTTSRLAWMRIQNPCKVSWNGVSSSWSNWRIQTKSHHSKGKQIKIGKNVLQQVSNTNICRPLQLTR